MSHRSHAVSRRAPPARVLGFAALILAAAPTLARAADPLDAVIETERAFATMAKQQGAAAAFKAFAAPDALTFGAEWEPVIGPDAIARQHAGDDDLLEWVPVGGRIAQSGDLAYTWGRFRATPANKNGTAAKPLLGKYVTIWRKQADGAWRFVLDTGAVNKPPPEGVPTLP